MVPPENENAESGDNGNDNADGGPQVEVNDVQQQQAQGGPSGDTGNYPNAETYSSKPKRYNKHQQEREDFQHQLLATLSKDSPEEEQDSTELAMQAMLKKIKRNLNADAQDDLIDELQQVVSRFIRQAKGTPVAPAVGTTNEVFVPSVGEQMEIGQDGTLMQMRAVSFEDM